MQNYLNARKRPLGILRAFGLRFFSGSWSKLLVLLITIIYVQEITISTVVQLICISFININNFRNTGLQTNHFWDNINQNSVQNLQGKKQSKKWRLLWPIKTFPLQLIDLLSNRVLSQLGLDEIIKLTLADDGAWLQVPPKLLFSK